MKDEEKNTQGSEKQSRGDAIKRWAKKPWFWPAVYLSACGILLSTFFLVQDGEDQAVDPADEQEEEHEEAGSEEDEREPADDEDAEQDAVPVTTEVEQLEMPVTDESEVEVIGTFYHPDSSTSAQQDALVYYNQMYYQNKGIDVAREDGEAFDVTAAASGDVVKAEQDPLLGHVVEIEHDEGLVSVYQSLEDLEVEEGDSITKGSVVGLAGRNLFNSEAGIHAHFEIRHDGQAMDPEELIGEPLDQIAEKIEEEGDEITEEEMHEDHEELPEPEEDEEDDEVEEDPEEDEELDAEEVDEDELDDWLE
ncbi:M23 family metallopeptidase [Salsuginibacillus kocurii]|uniref:M23 family metallopeptidase n=1 Tax=Salsuginibacillus kocurii TaxID=427078 RepID=UPI000360951A|nr:M23 family metallopeptidase [Salsuginibacillus kocurii]